MPRFARASVVKMSVTSRATTPLRMMFSTVTLLLWKRTEVSGER